MRNCPICDHNGKRVIMDNYDAEKMCLFECTRCGHRYIDALHLSQEWFDKFYLTQYTTDDKPYSDERLASLADCVASYWVTDALDIGGTDGELISHLNKHNVTARASGVGDNSKRRLQAVILSHTLEHIYDVPAMFKRVKAALIPDGLLFVEVPIHLGYKAPTEYDYHYQHINKFRPGDLEQLFKRNGFTIHESHQLPDYREYNVWRIAGWQKP